MIGAARRRITQLWRLASLCVALSFGLCGGLDDAVARDWIADSRTSTLMFNAWREDPNSSERRTFEGRFTVWRADISFDPAQPEAARLSVEIDIGSLNTGDGGLNAEIVDAPWLNARDHPIARYEARGFEPLGEGRYRSSGVLTLRGVSAPSVVEFRLRIEGDVALASGIGAVQRQSYGVGAHAGARIASPRVPIRFDIIARPAPPEQRSGAPKN